MENKREYFRVGTTLYKNVRRPLISGDFIEEKIVWSYEALRQDYGKNNLPKIEKYDGFCIIPSHINYQQVYGTFLNQYEPIGHMPCEGDFPYIRLFLEHIFEEQVELGLDYIQLLYTRPTQMLPILLLVSNERETGKTTFLRFLKAIFGKNATFNTNEDFKSQFNADWANRLLVLVDELLLNKMEDTEKIKNLSTAGDYKIEAKGKDRREIEFFAKFVLCSNNEKNPIIIPKEEIRFWVRKIKPVEKDITSLRELMAKEIPCFLYFLMNRKLSTQNESRMWFKPSLLETPALNKIKKYNSSKVEIEMAAYCAEVMERLSLETIIDDDSIMKEPTLYSILDFSFSTLGGEKYDKLKKEIRENYFPKISEPVKELIKLPASRVRFTKLDTVLSDKKVQLVVEGKTDAEIIEHAYYVLTNGSSPYWSIKSSGNVSGGGASEVAKSISNCKPLIEEDDIVIGIFDHDSKGLQEFRGLKESVFIKNKKDTVRKHRDSNIYALLLPVPGEMDVYLKKDQSFNFFEVEHYFGHQFLIDSGVVEKTDIPDVYKIKESKKAGFSKLVRGVHDRKVFMYFIDLFDAIDEITQIDIEYSAD